MNLFDKIRDTVGAMFGSEHREDEGEQLIAPIDPFARGLDYTKLIEGFASFAETLIEDGRLFVDVAEWVNEAMDAAELYCSDDLDRLYVGLLILYVRHTGLRQMAEFYAECLQRLLDGKTLRLLHYRELREVFESRVWWVFEGEPFDSERRELPQWAR